MSPPGLTESTAHVIASMLPRTSREVTSRGSMPTLCAAAARSSRLPPTSRPSILDEATDSARSSSRASASELASAFPVASSRISAVSVRVTSAATPQTIGQVDLVCAGTAVAPARTGDFTALMPLLQTCHRILLYSKVAYNIEYGWALFKLAGVSR